jgi:hypothetical protein
MTRMSRLGSDDSDEPNRMSPIGRAGLGPGRMLLAPPTFPAHSRRQARRRRRRRRHCRRRRLRAGPGAALPSIRRPGRVRCWAAVPSALRGHGAGATMYCHNADNSPPSRRVGCRRDDKISARPPTLIGPLRLESATPLDRLRAAVVSPALPRGRIPARLQIGTVAAAIPILVGPQDDSQSA